MPFSYNGDLMLLSAAVIIFGAFATLVMTADMHRRRVGGHHVRLLAASLCFGLSATAMQFIGIFAIKLPVRVSYDPEMAALAAVLPIAGGLIAFALGGSRKPGPAWLPISVVSLGVSLAGMHYVAMESISGALTPKYSPLGIALTALIAIQAAFITLWLVFRDRGVAQTLASAGAIGALIFIIHCAAMETTVFNVSGSLAGFAVPAISETVLSWAVAAGAYIFCSICLITFTIVQFGSDSR